VLLLTIAATEDEAKMELTNVFMAELLSIVCASGVFKVCNCVKFRSFNSCMRNLDWFDSCRSGSDLRVVKLIVYYKSVGVCYI